MKTFSHSEIADIALVIADLVIQNKFIFVSTLLMVFPNRILPALTMATMDNLDGNEKAKFAFHVSEIATED